MASTAASSRAACCRAPGLRRTGICRSEARPATLLRTPSARRDSRGARALAEPMVARKESNGGPVVESRVDGGRMEVAFWLGSQYQWWNGGPDCVVHHCASIGNSILICRCHWPTIRFEIESNQQGATIQFQLYCRPEKAEINPLRATPVSLSLSLTLSPRTYLRGKSPCLPLPDNA